MLPPTDSGASSNVASVTETLARPSGAFAMLAIDQRESLRMMLAEHQQETVTDAQITEFKLAVLAALTPFASGALIDKQFGWDAALSSDVVAESCRLIAAADRFISDANELIADVAIDEQVVPAKMKQDGAVALKLLVIWRPDEPPEPRVELVDRFIARCRGAGLLSIIEPVSRSPRVSGAWDHNNGILEAARELGSRGADLYKAEVPRKGANDEKAVRDDCARLSASIASPWVVLSNGVPVDDFPTAVGWACREGASGFLAGRGVWRNVIGRENLAVALREDAVPRFRRLVDIVEQTICR